MAVSLSLAEFAAAAANQFSIIFPAPLAPEKFASDRECAIFASHAAKIVRERAAIPLKKIRRSFSTVFTPPVCARWR
jgi:hypothetical protein